MAENAVDLEELHFLILHQLYQTCPAAAGILEREATERGLLPCRTDIFGAQHRLTYSQLAAKYPHVPPEGLRLLLQRCGDASSAVLTGGSHGAHTSLLSESALFNVGQPTRLTSTSDGSKSLEWDVEIFEQEPNELQVHPEELHFLILHQLYQTCPRAASVLEREATNRGLLPCDADMFGTRHNLTYAELKAKYPHVPPAGLQLLLRRSIDAGTSGGSYAQLPRGSTSSLLCTSLFPAPPDPEQDVVCAFTSDPTTSVSLAERLRQREMGIPMPRLEGMRMLNTALCGSLLQHQRSVRGHRAAVYCAVIDWTGQKVITGSDDRLVKIWSCQTALLLATCRGHLDEVHILAVNVCSSVVASGSWDTTIRCWSLKGRTLGHPISLLTGHTAPVSIVTFSRALPDALLSLSADGTCRIWNVRDPEGQAMHVLRATAPRDPVALSPASRPGSCNASGLASSSQSHLNTRGGAHGDLVSWGAHMLEELVTSMLARLGNSRARGPGREQARQTDAEPGTERTDSGHSVPEVSKLIACAFSPDSRFIVATSIDCKIYGWRWDLQKKGPGRGHVEMGIVDIEGAAERKPVLIGRWLTGHARCVRCLHVSPDGERVVTGSKDGIIQIWELGHLGRRPLHVWEPVFTFTCGLDEVFASTLRQRGKAVPRPSVHLMAWSHDRSKVLATVNDYTVRVWNATSGVRLYVLRVHTAHVMVLECHPSDSRLALTASFDGLAVVWDIQKGQVIARFSSKDMRPGGDVLRLIDGHWTQNGEGIVLGDAAGQVHFFGTGCSDMMAFSRYDQFFSSDYRPIHIDEEGRVFDEESGTEAHMRIERDLIVDFWGNRYPPAYQAAFRDRRATQLTLEEAQAECN